MQGNRTEFAQLLSAGIHLIRGYEAKKIACVQHELAEKLGLSHHSIEDWRKARNLPVQVSYVATLAREFVMRGKVDRKWVERFFVVAGYAAHAEAYCQEIFTKHPSATANERSPYQIDLHIALRIGGGELIRGFLDEFLVDELIVAVHPVVLGGGIPLIPAGTHRHRLRLVSQQAFDSGLVQLHYVVQR